MVSAQEGEQMIADALYLGLIAGFFALCWVFVALCDRA
jgi:hypothetical protein